MRILIAEDDSSTGLIFKTILESRGHDVTLTSNGEECLDAFRNSPKHFDAVIVDYRMPRKDGIAVASEIQIINRFQKIILASAYVNDIIDKASNKLLHPISFIEKPVDLDHLGETIEAFVLQSE